MSVVGTCRVASSGWPKPGAVNHVHRGVALTAELRRWSSGEARDADAAEEVGAALEGRFELVCGEDRYEIAAGQAILIPVGTTRRWRALEDGVLYRVVHRRELAA